MKRLIILLALFISACSPTTPQTGQPSVKVHWFHDEFGAPSYSKIELAEGGCLLVVEGQAGGVAIIPMVC